MFRKTLRRFGLGALTGQSRRRKRMNRFEGGGNRLAVIEYLDGDFRIVQTGSHVICAITGKSIPLDELRYWSVARQEAYVDAAASLEAEKKAGNLPA
ncbi:hypothetical protein L905_18470 [Agrobacterium sp. TS43]|nr:hypothetical protein L906_01520 [Agrobacterium sp. TS45]KVK65544.1 hypothetical protein L905_18470 [Agrobacterium sp. TS43]KVK68618.1 hypothetical protein L907_01525 [Agrobacterium sp. C13]